MNKNKLYAIGIMAVLLAAALILTGCPDPNNAAAAPQTVEAKYRFSTGFWYPYGGDGTPMPDAVPTLGKNSFTVTAAGIAYAGVYTAGGGTVLGLGSVPGEVWTYLYAPTGKIGIVKHYDTEGMEVVEVRLGKTYVDAFIASPSYEFEPSPDTSGMQDAHNGTALGLR